ncbi:cadherin-like domain-containing protein [Salinibacter ruber]|uniref:cadherin-like domain-containing protein n=1 Tax=Salinibacter ruber TaxID=146919 RepID=UPI002169927D|nr:cadherin-like domain-containing protein [Salinibacter ruber]MCS4201766.1 hypothetical protein [Salinibacter ruber]
MGLDFFYARTPQTPSHQLDAATMNVPKLLRTTLFSVFVFLLAGSFSVAQAQDATVTVDAEQGENIEDGLEELDDALTGVSDATGELIILGNDYRGEDRVDLTEDAAGDALDNIVNLEVVAEASSDGVEEVTIESILLDETSSVESVTFASDTGSERIRVTEGGVQNALTFEGADGDEVQVDIEEEGVLRVADGATVVRNGFATYASGTADIQYLGNGTVAELRYATEGQSIETTAEFPSSGDVGTLALNGEGSVSFDGSATVNTITSASGDGQIEAGLTVENGGGLTIEQNGLEFPVDVTVDVAGDADITGNVDVASGTLTTDGALTVDTDAGSNAVSVDGGTVSAASTNVDGTTNQIRATGAADIALGDVTFEESNPRFNLAGLDAGTDTGVSVGDVTASFSADAIGNDDSFIEGGGDFTANALTLNDESSGLTLEVRADEPSADYSLGSVADGPAVNLNVESAGPDAPEEGRIRASGSDFNAVDVVANGTINIDGSGDASETTIAGAVNNDGAFTVDPGVVFDGAITNNGTLTANGGTDFNGAVTNGGTLTANGDTEFGGTVTNSGTLTANGVTEFGGGVTNNSTLAANATVTYLFESAALENNGEIEIDEGQTFSIDASESGGNILVGGGPITGPGTFNVNTGDGITATIRALNHDFPNTEHTGSGTLEVNVTNDDGSEDDGSVVFTDEGAADGDLVAEAPVNFVTSSAGATDDQIREITVGDLTASADVNFSGGNLEANELIADAGTLDLDGLSFPETDDVTLQNEGTLALGNGQLFQIQRDLTRTGGANPQLNANGGFIRFAGTADSEIDPGSAVLKINGTVQVFKENAESATVDVANTIQVDNGGIEIVQPFENLATTTVRFQDNIIVRNGEFEVRRFSDRNGEVDVETGENALIFRNQEGNASTNSISSDGDRALEIARVTSRGGPAVVNVSGTVTVTDRLTMRDSGFEVSGTLNPGQDAEVVRFVPESNPGATVIQEFGDGAFNGAENMYNLIYRGVGTAATEDELDDRFTSDLSVEVVDAGAPTVQLDDSYDIGGVLTVESDDDFSATLDDNGNSLELTGDGLTHSVAGTIEGSSSTLVLSGEGATVEGSADLENDPATLASVDVNAPNVTLQDIQQVSGDLTVNPSFEADGSTVQPALTIAGSVTPTMLGPIDANNPVTLETDVRVEGSSGSVSVNAAADGENGSIAFGGNDLVLADVVDSDGNVTDGFGGSFVGEEGASYSSSGGVLIFDGENRPTFDTSGESIPNVEVEQPIALGEDNSTPESTVVGSELAVNAGTDGSAGVQLNDDTLDVSGSLTLNAQQETDNSTPKAIGDEENDTGVLRVSDATITVNQNLDGDPATETAASQGISRLTVAGGSDVTVASSADDQGRSLYVPAVFTLADDFSGTFTQDDVSVSVTGSDLGSGNDPGSAVVVEEGATGNVAASDTSRFFLVETGRGEPSVALNDDVTFDRLAVADLRDGGESESASLGTQGGVLTVNDQLQLAGGLDNQTATVNGSDIQTLALGDGATIERRKPSSPASALTGTDVLTEVPTFGESLNLAYTTPDGVSAAFTSGREVPSASASTSIASVEVGVGDGSGSGEVDFQAVDTNNGIATGNVVVTGAFDLESGTVEHGVADQPASRRLEIAEGGVFAQKDGSLLETSGNPDAQSISASDYTLRYYPNGGNVTTSGQEFLTGGAVSTLEFIDGPVSSPSDDNLELHADREVGALTVNRSGASTLDLKSGPSGDETEKTLTVTGGSDLTAGTVNDGTLQTEGDVAVDGGDIGGSATLSFAGNGDQSLSLSGDETLGTVALNQTTPDGEAVPSATVSGGGLEGDATFNNGLLVIEGDNALDLGTNGFSRSTADEDTSHVVGSVTQRVNSGNTVAEYPVGSSNASYRPFGFIFPEAPTQDTDITVTHVDENPGEVGGLPFTDNTEEGVRIGQDYPDYYWTTESSRRLSISGTYEAFAQAEDLRFPDESADDFRIIRRPDSGDSWSLVGEGTGYSNAPISESEGRVDVSTTAATSDIRQSVGLFTIGQPAGDAPQIATNEGLTLTEGESAPITSAELEATDGDNAAGELTFEVTSGPSQGEIQVDGSQSSTFTQADVNNELVSYNHTASSSDNDSFELEVSDPNGNSVSATFDVTVEAGQVAISGSVEYPTEGDGALAEGRPLSGDGFEVVATPSSGGDPLPAVTPNENGAFTIDGLSQGTDYDVTVEVSASVDAGVIDVFDAQRVVNGSIGRVPFAGPFQEEVADVTNDDNITSRDGLAILLNGGEEPFAAGQWAATEQTVTAGTDEEANLRVAQYGDADLNGGNGSNNNNSTTTLALSESEQSEVAARTAASAAASGADVKAEAGETFEVPVRVEGDASIGAYDLQFSYDEENVSFEGASVASGELFTDSEEGAVGVSWLDETGESPLSASDGSPVVTLSFAAEEGVEEESLGLEVSDGRMTDPSGSTIRGATLSAPTVSVGAVAPEKFALKGNYPNPIASGQATIEMDLPSSASVTVEVYNTLGQQVMSTTQSMQAGSGQTVKVDGSQLSSGQYFYRVKADLKESTVRETGRMTVVR